MICRPRGKIPISNEVENLVPLFSILPKETNNSFFNGNAVNPERVLINEPLISSKCSETYTVLFKEASQLGDLETEIDNIFLEIAEQFLLFENTSEEQVQENVIGGGKFNEKFMSVEDNIALLVRPRHMSKDQSNRHLHMLHMIAVEKRILIPEDLIDIRISHIKIYR